MALPQGNTAIYYSYELRAEMMIDTTPVRKKGEILINAGATNSSLLETNGKRTHTSTSTSTSTSPSTPNPALDVLWKDPVSPARQTDRKTDSTNKQNVESTVDREKTTILFQIVMVIEGERFKILLNVLGRFFVLFFFLCVVVVGKLAYTVINVFY